MAQINKDKFDQMLRRALKKHSEPIPPNFTAKVLKLIREQEASAPQPTETELDEILARALQKHSEPTPDDFTARLLKQVKDSEQLTHVPLFDKTEFDETLIHTLKAQPVPTPPDFTANVLQQIKELNERKALTRVIFQERLALAASITLIASIIAAVFIFPGIAVSFTKYTALFTAKAPQTIKFIRFDWQFYVAFTAALAFIGYNLFDLLAADK